MKANDALIVSRRSLPTVEATASLIAKAPMRVDPLRLTSAKGTKMKDSRGRAHGRPNETILLLHGDLSSLWK